MGDARRERTLVQTILALVHHRVARSGGDREFCYLWLAISNPDQLIVTDDEYRHLKSELKAQPPAMIKNKPKRPKLIPAQTKP